MDRPAAVAERKFDNHDWARFGAINRKGPRTVRENGVRSHFHIVKTSDRISWGSRRRRHGHGYVGTRQYKINLREVPFSIEMSHGNPVPLDNQGGHRAVHCFD